MMSSPPHFSKVVGSSPIRDAFLSSFDTVNGAKLMMSSPPHFSKVVGLSPIRDAFLSFFDTVNGAKLSYSDDVIASTALSAHCLCSMSVCVTAVVEQNWPASPVDEWVWPCYEATPLRPCCT